MATCRFPLNLGIKMRHPQWRPVPAQTLRIPAATRLPHSTYTDGPLQQQRGKLTEVLEMPLGEDSHELVTLRLEDESTLKIRKALLALISPELSEVLLDEPTCSELKVAGSASTWQQLLSMLFWAEDLELKPEDVQKLLPIAHQYHMEGAMRMIAACARVFQFSTRYGDMYVMTWLALAERYQAPGLGMACAKFILEQLADEMCKKSGPNEHWRQGLLREFRRDAIDRVKCPPEIKAFLKVAFQAQGAHAGL